MERFDYSGAESMVVADLQKRGWQVLARNFRGRGFELDIVAYRAEVICITEVKLRKLAPRCAADLSALLGYRKRQALLRGALRFLGSYRGPPYSTVRFDLAVIKARPHHAQRQKNATTPPLQMAPLAYYENVMAFDPEAPFPH